MRSYKFFIYGLSSLFRCITNSNFIYLVDRFKIPLDLTAVPVIENFVGRQADLDRLWQYFMPTDSQRQKVAVLHGLGGIGKTQLAVHFAREHQHEFTAIFWLSGKDRGTLLQSFSSVLPRLPGQSQTHEAIGDEELEQRATQVLQWSLLPISTSASLSSIHYLAIPRQKQCKDQRRWSCG